MSTHAPAEQVREPADLAAFARDVDALRAELDAALGPSDLAHFQKMERWGRVATGLGYATAWLGPNPVSIALLALGSTARWTIVAHHVSHRGLDRVPGAPSRYESETFARGLRRRLVDWLDWVEPAAWDYEHNVLHHYRVGERADPDLVEHHMEAVRTSRLPDAVKLGVVAFYATTWRLVYYAPNTFQVLQEARRAKATGSAGEDVEEVETRIFRSFDPRTAEGRAFYASITPYALVRFGLAPLAFAVLGPSAAASVLVNTALAEVVTNVHTFCLIAPNHAGDDLHRFSERPVGRGELYSRQVLGSADFTGGTDVADFLQGFLNYQIEHHLFPDLPPSKLREAQPAVRALCEKHGIAYVREPLHQRVRQLLGIMTGRRSMKRAATASEATRTRPRNAPGN